jgi:hypothetical protein
MYFLTSVPISIDNGPNRLLLPPRPHRAGPHQVRVLRYQVRDGCLQVSGSASPFGSAFVEAQDIDGPDHGKTGGEITWALIHY